MEANPRGIPKAPFVDNVADYISDAEPADVVLRKFQEAVGKYKYMEVNTLQRKKSLESKIPEIRKTLEAVEFLKTRQETGETVDAQFELNDTLYVNAKIEAQENVYLWLGANVMLEYSIPEAVSLLSSKLATAETTLKQVNEDLEFLRDQVTTMEVNTARVYNWDVKQRRAAKAS